MARKKTSADRVTAKASLSSRLQEIRQERYGDHGGPELARGLNLAVRTWYNYELGVTVPAEVLLAFIDQTGANPDWLLHGAGPRYLPGNDEETLAEIGPFGLIRRGLELLESAARTAAPPALAVGPAAGCAALAIIPLRDLSKRGVSPTQVEGHVLACRDWLPHPDDTVAVRLVDGAMNPILPTGSVVAIDRAVDDARRLDGQLVAARPAGETMVRRLEISSRHLFFRPDQPSQDHPLVVIEREGAADDLIIGQVICRWDHYPRAGEGSPA